MNAERITPAYIAPYYVELEMNTLYMPERVRLMALWVYLNHDDFLEEWFASFDEDGEWLGTMTLKQIKVLQAKKEKMAKELKQNFPDVKQQNVLYDNILDILKELVLETIE